MSLSNRVLQDLTPQPPQCIAPHTPCLPTPSHSHPSARPMFVVKLLTKRFCVKGAVLGRRVGQPPHFAIADLAVCCTNGRRRAVSSTSQELSLSMREKYHASIDATAQATKAIVLLSQSFSSPPSSSSSASSQIAGDVTEQAAQTVELPSPATSSSLSNSRLPPRSSSRDRGVAREFGTRFAGITSPAALTRNGRTVAPFHAQDALNGNGNPSKIDRSAPAAAATTPTTATTAATTATTAAAMGTGTAKHKNTILVDPRLPRMGIEWESHDILCVLERAYGGNGHAHESKTNLSLTWETARDLEGPDARKRVKAQQSAIYFAGGGTHGGVGGVPVWQRAS